MRARVCATTRLTNSIVTDRRSASLASRPRRGFGPADHGPCDPQQFLGVGAMNLGRVRGRFMLFEELLRAANAAPVRAAHRRPQAVWRPGGPRAGSSRSCAVTASRRGTITLALG